MDRQKEKALLGWASGIIDLEDFDSLKTIDYGMCFISILQYMDSSACLDEIPNTKERVLAVKTFLEDFYNVSFSDKQLVDFSILLEPVESRDTQAEMEIAKVLLLLLCAGIQDKNSHILTAAMRVEATLHWEVRQLIEAVIRPDDPATSLPSDFAKVFLQCSVMEVRDSPLRMRIASLNLSNLNDSLQTSPLRPGDAASPATPLEELVNSPQLARKIMRRDKEYRCKLERQVKEKEESLKKCQHDLRTGTHLRDELELDLQESQTQIERRDCRIRELEEKLQRMRAVQDQLNELAAVQHSNLELERDVESLRKTAQTAEMMKQYCQSLREENRGLYEELSTLQEKVERLEGVQCEANKAEMMGGRLRTRVEELEAQLGVMGEAQAKALQERRALEADMEVLRRVNEQQRQQLMDRSGSVGDVSGECMEVVTDKLMEELRGELDMMRSTWISPDTHAVTLHELQASADTINGLRAEIADVWRKLELAQQDVGEANQQLHLKEEQVQQLLSDSQQHKEQSRCLQQSLDDIRTQQMTLGTHCTDLETKLELKTEECQGHLDKLQESGKDSDCLKSLLSDAQEQCKGLTSKLEDKEKELEQLRASLTETQDQHDQLTSQLETEKSQCERLQSENIQVSEECNAVKQDLEEAVSQNKQLKDQVSSQDSELEKLKDEMALKDEGNRTIRFELDSKCANFELLKKVLEKKETECSDLRSDLVDKSSKCDQLTADITAKDSALKDLEASVELKGNQCQDLEVKLSEKSEKTDFFVHRCEELERSLAEQTQKVATLTTSLATSQQSNQQAEEALACLKSTAGQETQHLASLLQDKDNEIRTLQSRLQEEHSHSSQLETDLAAEKEASQGLQESERSLQVKVEALTSRTSRQDKLMAEKEAEREKLRETFNSMETELMEIKGTLTQAKLFTDQVESERDRLQTELNHLKESTASRGREAETKHDEELGSLKSTHLAAQARLEARISDLEQEAERRGHLLHTKSDDLEKERKKFETMCAEHNVKLDYLNKELTAKTEDLHREKERRLLKEKELTALEVVMHAVEDKIKPLLGDQDDKKSLLENLESALHAATQRETELREVITEHKQQAATLDQTVKELQSLLQLKEQSLQEAEMQVDSLRQSASAREDELKKTICLHEGEVTKLTQKVEHQDSVRSQTEQTLHEMKVKHKSELDTLKMSGAQQLDEHREAVRVHKEKIAELTESLDQTTSALRKTEAALQTLTTQAQEDKEKLHAEMETMKLSASERESALQESVMKYSQQLNDLTKEVEELNITVLQKESLLQQVESDSASQVQNAQRGSQTLAESFAMQEQELRTTISSLRQEMTDKDSQASQKIEELSSEVQRLTCVMEEKEEERAQSQRELSNKLTATLEEADQLRRKSEQNKVLAAKQEVDLSTKLTEAQQAFAVKERELSCAMDKLIGAVEHSIANPTESEQPIERLSELESACAPGVSQLSKSLCKLLQESKDAADMAEQRQQEILARAKESEAKTTQLQSTVCQLSEESRLLRLSASDREKELEKQLSEVKSQVCAEAEHYSRNQEESEKTIQSLSVQVQTLHAQKQEAEKRVDDSEEYWTLQLKNLQEEMESDMKQQRLTFENELAEQRAEYETRLNSALEEQEGVRLGQRAILEDKVAKLQETLTFKQAEFSRLLGEKQAEFARVMGEKEAEFREKVAAQEAEREKQLASVQQCLQQEAQSQQAIRSQMSQDRSKIQQLETQMAERRREFEELLQTEQLEREEVVRKVVEENQERVVSLQTALNQERQDSLRQVQQLQAETAEIKEQLTLSVQRTSNLQQQLSSLQSQKDCAVHTLEREVETQIAAVRDTEEENQKLKAKIAELESAMGHHKAELSSLKSSLKQQRGQRGEQVTRESQLQVEMKTQQQSHEEQIGKLSAHVTSLETDFQTLQAENKKIQEKAAQTAKSMAEQLKHYERKCQQSESHRTAMEERLQVYVEKEVQWKEDTEKLKEMTQRLEELESVTKMNSSHSSTGKQTSPSGSLRSQRHYNLRSSSHQHLDASFTSSDRLPETPGAAERQMSLLDHSLSGSSHSSGRHSMYSVGSAKSVVFVPTGAGRMFSCEDEPESPKFEWGRLKELQRRNTLCLPHMKSSYPVETQALTDKKPDHKPLQEGRPEKQSLSNQLSTESLSSRKRKPESMEVDEGPAAHVGRAEVHSRKLARHGPAYQKPGPPTPVYDRPRRNPSQRSNDRRSITPRRSPRCSPRVQTSTGGLADKTLIKQESCPEGLSFDIGFSPVSSGSRRLARQKAFISKSDLPKQSGTDSSATTSNSCSSITTTASKMSKFSKGKSPLPQGVRKPLRIRNCLQTHL